MRSKKSLLFCVTSYLLSWGSMRFLWAAKLQHDEKSDIAYRTKIEWQTDTIKMARRSVHYWDGGKTAECCEMDEFYETACHTADCHKFQAMRFSLYKRRKSNSEAARHRVNQQGCDWQWTRKFCFQPIYNFNLIAILELSKLEKLTRSWWTPPALWLFITYMKRNALLRYSATMLSISGHSPIPGLSTITNPS